jgi:membrane protein required for colicin V production
MIPLNNLTSFDLVIVVVFLFFLARGVWIGFMRQLAAFFALLGSYWLAGRYAGEMAPYISRFVENPRIIFFGSFAILFMLTAVLFILAGEALHRVMQITLLGWFDRLLGFLLGAVKAAVVASILFMALEGILSSENPLLTKSVSAPFLVRGAAMVQHVINDPEIRKLFVRKEPAIK